MYERTIRGYNCLITGETTIVYGSVHSGVLLRAVVDAYVENGTRLPEVDAVWSMEMKTDFSHDLDLIGSSGFDGTILSHANTWSGRGWWICSSRNGGWKLRGGASLAAVGGRS